MSINNGVMYAAFFEHARPDAGIKFKGKVPEPYYLNADGLRLFVDYFLPYYLLIEDTGGLQQMSEVLRQVIAMNLAVKQGTQDLFKIDGTGFHHHVAYHGGYAPETFQFWAQLVYLLAEPIWSAKQLSVLKKALQTHRFITQLCSVPRGLRGRLLTKREDGSSISVLKAMALLAHPNSVADQEMQARFKEYLDSDYVTSDEQLANFYKGDCGVLIDGLGIFRLVADIEALDIAAAPTPTGAVIKPYAAAGFYRMGNWLAAVKGFSRYFWDYEGCSVFSRIFLWILFGRES